MLGLLFLLMALWPLVVKIVSIPYKRKLRAARDYETSMELRKSLKDARYLTYTFFLLIAGLIGLFFILAVSSYLDSEAANRALKIYPIAIIILYVAVFVYLVKKTNYLEEIEGNVSTLSYSDFLNQDSRFCLFLRGFERDIYGIDDSRFEFSEQKLSRVVERGLGIPMYAVGMTREADSPLGGPRVYLSDDSWQHDVNDMMDKAERIFILVNNRDSCLWEIKRAKEFYLKCVFIIDDISIYEDSRTILKDYLALPTVPRLEYDDMPIEYDTRRFYFTSDNILKPFEGTFIDYCKIAGIEDKSLNEEIVRNPTRDFYTHPLFLFVAAVNLLYLIRYLC